MRFPPRWTLNHWAVTDKILQQKILKIVDAKFPSARSAKAPVFGLLQVTRGQLALAPRRPSLSR
jgi:hypothetical protein